MRSPSGIAWWERAHRAHHPPRTESQEILHDRRAAAGARDGTQSHWPDFLPRATDGAEAVSHYHWRMLHKNLGKPILRTGRVSEGK